MGVILTLSLQEDQRGQTEVGIKEPNFLVLSDSAHCVGARENKAPRRMLGVSQQDSHLGEGIL